MKMSLWQKVFLYTLLFTGAVPMLVPLFWMISTSLKPSLGIDELPQTWLPITKFYTLNIDGRNYPVNIIQTDRGKGTASIKFVFEGNDNSILIPQRWITNETGPENFKKVAFVLFKGDAHEINAEGILVSRDSANDTLRVLLQESIIVPEAILGKPGKLDARFGNYPEAISKMNLRLQLINTLVIVLWCMLGTTLSSAIVGYTFARGRFAGRTKLFIVVIATMMLPSQVTMIPTFILFKNLGWMDTYFPFIIPSFLGNAFFIFLFRQYFLTIPSDLEDAARIDGCGHFGTFWHIMLPMAKPIVITVIVFTFMGAWNDFMGPLIYLNTETNYTLAIGLDMFRGQYGSMQPNLVMAASAMMMLPVLVIFFLAQNAFMKGVVVTGVKG